MRVVVVARDELDLLWAQGLAEGGEHGFGSGDRLPQRPVAQLEGVAEQDEPVGLRRGLLQRGERCGAPQRVRAGSGAEVQVADDEGAHPAPGAG